MATYHLDAVLSGHVFAFMLLLSRMGAVIMLFPGIGDRYVPARTRMVFACMLCFLLLEPMLPRLPSLPPSLGDTARLVVYEVIIGLFFGTLLRLTVSALESAGMIIGMETGLSNATMINPSLATQSPLPSAFLSSLALALIFETGLDHFLLRATFELYDAFPVGGEFMPGDMAQIVMRTTNKSFAVGIELAAPFMIMGLLMYTALGVLQRLLPQVQLFMVSLPLQIWGGLTLFSLTAAGIMTAWLHYIDDAVGSFFRG